MENVRRKYIEWQFYRHSHYSAVFLSLGPCAAKYVPIQVKQLRMDRQVLEAHEAATSALKTCREAQGLTVERVEDTLGALAEVT